jgi:hypothetical protein
MEHMVYWTVVVAAEQYAGERLLGNDFLELKDLDGPLPAAGDRVALVAAGPEPVIFGLGEVGSHPDGAADPDDPMTLDQPSTVDIAYTHRRFDAPLPAGELAIAGPGLHALDATTFADVAARVGEEHRVGAANRQWLVSVDLPIEADSPAEAVRSFWTYVLRLGPRELPAFVSPLGDELAMQAYVLGEPTNLDPEEDED